MAGQEAERKGNPLPFRISGGNLGMSHFRGAIFIDGGYLDQVLIGFGKARIDYSKLLRTTFR